MTRKGPLHKAFAERPSPDHTRKDAAEPQDCGEERLFFNPVSNRTSTVPPLVLFSFFTTFLSLTPSSLVILAFHNPPSRNLPPSISPPFASLRLSQPSPLAVFALTPIAFSSPLSLFLHPYRFFSRLLDPRLSHPLPPQSPPFTTDPDSAPSPDTHSDTLSPFGPPAPPAAFLSPPIAGNI